MGTVLVVVAIAVIAGWWWVVSKGNSYCPLCNHPMSAHERTTMGELTRRRSFCTRCNQECS